AARRPGADLPGFPTDAGDREPAEGGAAPVGPPQGPGHAAAPDEAGRAGRGLHPGGGGAPAAGAARPPQRAAVRAGQGILRGAMPTQPRMLDEISTRWPLIHDPAQFVLRYGPAIEGYLAALVRDPDLVDEIRQDFLVRVL